VIKAAFCTTKQAKMRGMDGFFRAELALLKNVFIKLGEKNA
jgi:hypothetical protein